MARQIRIEYAGAVYHVIAKGNQGGRIYADNSDRKLWLETLGEVCEKTGWRIYAFVMMGNPLCTARPLFGKDGEKRCEPVIGNKQSRVMGDTFIVAVGVD